MCERPPQLQGFHVGIGSGCKVTSVTLHFLSCLHSAALSLGSRGPGRPLGPANHVFSQTSPSPGSPVSLSLTYPQYPGRELQPHIFLFQRLIGADCQHYMLEFRLLWKKLESASAGPPPCLLQLHNWNVCSPVCCTLSYASLLTLLSITLLGPQPSPTLLQQERI